MMTASRKLQFRVLDEEDVNEFQEIRLEAIRGHPEAFLGDYDVELRQPREFFQDMIRKDKVVGCFRNGELQGIAGYYVITPEGKRQHSAKVWGFYVRDRYRGRGFAKTLMKHLIDEIPSDVEKLLLKVHARNRKALRFYKTLGFEIYGLEKKSLKIDDEYYDDYLMVKFLD